MKRKLLVLTALLSLCVLLAACKKSDDTISTPASTATSSAGPEATPEPTLPPYEANVLTGEPKGADYPEGQRITSVMVNNIVAARPQRGLSKADILFEIKVEGGITRFMPVFTDYKTIGEIGPVRSGRDQFFRLILPWQALYIHEGQSVVMQQYAIDFSYGNLNNNDGANGYRDYGRVNWAGKSYNNGTLALEHTMYTNSDNIQEYIDNNKVDMNKTYNSPSSTLWTTAWAPPATCPTASTALTAISTAPWSVTASMSRSSTASPTRLASSMILLPTPTRCSRTTPTASGAIPWMKPPITRC